MEDKEIYDNSFKNENPHSAPSNDLPIRYCSNPNWFDSYGCQKYSRMNPLYKSTSMEYGWYPPNENTAPLTYHPARRAFTEHLHTCGMYRNTSLNTAMDPKPWGVGSQLYHH